MMYALGRVELLLAGRTNCGSKQARRTGDCHERQVGFRRGRLCLTLGKSGATPRLISHPMSQEYEKRQAKGCADRRVCHGCKGSLAPQNRYPLTPMFRRTDVIRSVAVWRPPTKPSCSAIPAPGAA